MAWTRFKQGTREAFGKSEKYTELPEDIVELNDSSQALMDIYNSLIGGGVVSALKHSSSNLHQVLPPLNEVSEGWRKIISFEKGGKGLETKTADFIDACSTTVKQVDDLKIACDLELEESYLKTLKEVVKLCKEGGQLFERVKSKRLELDSKKYRLEHASKSDADKLAHYENSVTQMQERFDSLVLEYRQLMTPLYQKESFEQLQCGLVASFIKSLKSYHQKSMQRLDDLDKKLNLPSFAKFDSSFFKNAMSTLTASASKTSLNSLADEGGVLEGGSSVGGVKVFPGTPPLPSKQVPTIPSKPKTVKVTALFAFNSVEPGDLSFGKDAIIEVVKQEGDWWEGIYQGKRGTFPSNYVKILE